MDGMVELNDLLNNLSVLVGWFAATCFYGLLGQALCED